METQYLIVSGIITVEGTLELVPSFLTSQPAREALDERQALEAEPPEEALTVETLGRDGIVLGREALPIEPLCLLPLPTSASQVVGGLVTFPSGTRLLRFSHNGRLLQEIEVPREPPIVNLQWELGKEVGGEQTLTWQAEHPVGADLAFIVLYTHAPDEWRPVSLVLRDNVAAVDFDGLPGGETCQIRVLASDGANTAIADSPPFKVALKGLEPIIVQPDDGSTVPANTLLILEGVTMDWEGAWNEAVPMRWRSSIDGELGEGELLDVTLSSGIHEITLAAGRGDRTSETSISVTVQGAPPQ